MDPHVEPVSSPFARTVPTRAVYKTFTKQRSWLAGFCLMAGAIGSAQAQLASADQLAAQQALCDRQRADAGGSEDESAAPACALLARMKPPNVEAKPVETPVEPPPPVNKLGQKQETHLNCLMSPQLPACKPN